MLTQAAEELLELYISMSKVTLTKVVQNHIDASYLTHGEDDQEVYNVFQHL